MKGHVFPTVVLTAVILTCGLAATSAQTIGYAEAIDRLAAACGKDIRAHCRGVNLGNGRIANCLKRNSARVSKRCNETSVVVWALLEKRATAQATAAKICQADAAEYCRGVQPGEANILSCLLEASGVVSAKCNQAITDAGWR